MPNNQPIASVVRTAASPAQAKIFVAMLQAEGIPAHVDGDTLADEIAVSRAIMNLGSIRVLVPTSSLPRAREILANAVVDEAELTAQALAAADPETAPRVRPPAGRRGPWLTVMASALAFLFLSLWRGEVGARERQQSPLLRYEAIDFGVRQIRAADGVVIADCIDRDRNGHYEKSTQFCSGDDRIVATDDDDDLRFESVIEYRGPLESRWIDVDRDGVLDECRVVEGATGKELQLLRYVAGTGFVLQ